MWTDEFRALFCLMAMAAMVRVSYELALRQRSSEEGQETHEALATASIPLAASNPEFPALSPMFAQKDLH